MDESLGCKHGSTGNNHTRIIMSHISLVIYFILQVVLDFFAVITYVTDYYAKDDTGKLEIIKQMIKESQCQSLKEKMRIVANAYLTHRPIGEAEAIFRLIPHLTLSMSNLKAQFVMLGPKDERSVR